MIQVRTVMTSMMANRMVYAEGNVNVFLGLGSAAAAPAAAAGVFLAIERLPTSHNAK
jgi:hypothetical protein